MSDSRVEQKQDRILCTDVTFISSSVAAYHIFNETKQTHSVDIYYFKTREKITTLLDEKSPDKKIHLVAMPNSDLITVSDSRIIYWSAEIFTEKPKNREIAETNLGRISGVCLLADGSLLTADAQGDICSWNILTGKHKLIENADISIISMYMNEKEQLVLLGYSKSINPKRTSCIFDFKTGSKKIVGLSHIAQDRFGYSQSSALLTSNRLAIIGGDSKNLYLPSQTLRILNLDNATVIFEKETKKPLRSLTICPNGWLACYEEGGIIEFFDPDTYERMEILELSGRKFGCIHWNPWSHDEFIEVHQGGFPFAINCGFEKKISDALYEVGQVTKDPSGIILSYLFPERKKECVADQKIIPKGLCHS